MISGHNSKFCSPNTKRSFFYSKKKKKNPQDTPSSFKSGTSYLGEYPASEFFVDFIKGK